MTAALMAQLISQPAGASQVGAQEITLSSVESFGTSQQQLTAAAGWPDGKTPVSIVSQGSFVHGFIRRAWKPTANDGTWLDLVAGWRHSAGALDEIDILLDDASTVTVKITVTEALPSPTGAGTTKILDAAASGGQDYTDWATAVAGLAAGDVLVVRAREGGEVYTMDSNEGGPASTVDDVTIVADPDDIAAGRRPRVQFRATDFAPLLDSQTGQWESYAGDVYRTVRSDFPSPGSGSPLQYGGLYQAADGAWKRLYRYGSLSQLEDTSYARTGKPNTVTYVGPGIHYTGGRYYIRLTPPPDATISNTAGSAPIPPWDWSRAYPASLDPNSVKVILSHCQRYVDSVLGNSNWLLDIENTSGWRIRNLDFCLGAIGIQAAGSNGLRLEGCRFFGGSPRDSFDAADTDLNDVPSHLHLILASDVRADRCEFWGGDCPWVSWQELKNYVGQYGSSQRTRLAYAEGCSALVLNVCRIDGFNIPYFWGTHNTAGQFHTGTIKHHSCLIVDCGTDGFSVCQTVDGGHVYDFIRCAVFDGTLTGWSGGTFSGVGDMRVGVNLYYNVRPAFSYTRWYINESDVDSNWTPCKLENGHGSYPVPNTYLYGNTLIGTNNHRNAFIGGSIAGGSGSQIGPPNIGNLGSRVHRTRNNIAAVIPSPYVWEIQSSQGGADDSHIGFFVHTSAFSATVDMDCDWLHRYAGMPSTGGRDWFATAVTSGAAAQQCNDIAAVRSASGQETNGAAGDPQFASTPLFSDSDATRRDLARYVPEAAGALSGGNESLAGQSWPDVDFGVEITYPGQAFFGALDPAASAVEQQVGTLAPMPSTGATAPTPDTEAPTTPTNLSATAASSSQIDLTWTASTDNVAVDHYNIYRDGAGTPIDQASGTSYSDTGLTASTAYSYTVSAVDAAGNESSQSASDSATTQAASGATAEDMQTLDSETMRTLDGETMQTFGD